MKKTYLSMFTFILMISLLSGCGKADMQGIIINVSEKSVWFADNLSLDRFEEIKDELSSTSKINSAIKQEVRDTGGDVDLFDLAYDDADELEVGNEVNVWLGGAIGESFPATSKARKIEMEE